MGKFEDEQYGKLSQKMSDVHNDREHSKQITKLMERDMKSGGRRR